MIYIEQELVKCLLFCDVPVEKMELNRHQLKIYVRHAYINNKEDVLFADRTDLWLGKGVLVFSDWSELELLRYDQKGENPVIIDKHEFEQLEDILMFEINDNLISISGFGIKIGHWIEINIKDSRYYGEFEEHAPSI